MNHAYDLLCGNDLLKQFLQMHITEKSLAHAYILEGAEGTGKHTAARLIAMSLACKGKNPPCLVCEACRKITEGICPDVITIGIPSGKKTIGVDAVRAIRSDAYISPNDLDCKIFILEDMQAMTPQAQNALLKILEEPPENVWFLLLCDNASALIPTVRSRAPELKLQVFTEDVLSEYLLSRSEKAEKLSKSDPEAYRLLLRTAGGSLGKAIRLAGSRASDKASALSRSVADYITRLCASSRAEFILFAATLSLTREDTAEFMRQLSAALRDLAAVKKTKNACCLFYPSRADAELPAARVTYLSVLRMRETVQKYYEDTLANVNLQTAMLMLAQTLWELK